MKVLLVDGVELLWEEVLLVFGKEELVVFEGEELGVLEEMVFVVFVEGDLMVVGERLVVVGEQLVVVEEQLAVEEDYGLVVVVEVA